MEIKAQLTDEQFSKYENWMLAIKKKYGSYGQITWHLTQTGIGLAISVTTTHKFKELNLTNVNDW